MKNKEIYIDDLPKTNRMLAFEEINKNWKIISDFYYEKIFKHCLGFISNILKKCTRNHK